MKSRDLNKQEQQSKQKDKIAGKSNRPMPPKVKYKHKNHWLAQEDEDFDLPILNYEEE